jgi:cobalt-zinc-cadmium efflux system outer membrane protein
MVTPETNLIGGRRRAGRIPRPSKPGQVLAAAAMAQAPAMRLPPALPVPGSSPREPSGVTTSIGEDEGPSDGLTLDAAIHQMLTANLDVQALKYEIPQADADILTAGLRTNPLIYVDEQFIPYGAFTNARPGGPTQYDVNITYPIDLTHKRQARVRVARSAKSVLEAQFQDVIRRQIGNLYRAFVDLQSARINLLAAQASVREQERVVDAARRRAGSDEQGEEQAIERLEIVLDKARADLSEAGGALGDAQEAMALLLNSPPEQAAAIQPRGGLRDLVAAPPPLEELMLVAMACRPDLIAARRGIGRAEAEIDLQRANRLDDVFLFYDPLTYQDNSPVKLKSARSWVVAMTFPLPIYNRNQGNIARSRSNLQQTRTELAALERRVLSEVRLADREYHRSREALERIETTILPRARRAFARNSRDYAAGKISEDEYLSHLDDEAEAERGLREALIRHRRSMLDLNTTVGLRLLP